MHVTVYLSRIALRKVAFYYYNYIDQLDMRIILTGFHCAFT